MPETTYVIIGGGMTGAAAVQGIRAADPHGSITLIGAEPNPPYKRPPLTKKLWQGKSETDIWIKLPEENVQWIPECEVTGIDPARKSARDAAGNEYRYQRLLLATGGSPRRLPFGKDDILYYRTFQDYQILRSWTGKGARIGVIGGGFIGSEIAAALAANQEQPVMLFPEAGIGAGIYPADLAEFVTGYYREHGVEIHTGAEAQAVERRAGRLLIRTSAGEEIVVDHIVAGIGITPNTALAEAAGLKLAGKEAGGGIVVDEQLRTSQPDIYAAGDAASFYNPALQRRMRVEHEDNADSMGRRAGLNMAGQTEAYDYLPFFYSDLFDLGYEAVGDLDSGLETVADWQEPFRKGVVYYLKEGRVRGVLLWNTWDQVEAARRLIAGGEQVSARELKGRLPEE